MFPQYQYSRKVIIATNSSCNLKCTYCYEKEKESTNTSFNVDEVFSSLKNLLRTKSEYGTKIKLLGGESFLVFDKLSQLCERLWNDKDIVDYFHVHVTTNGTLIHGRIQEWLYKNRGKITLKLSLDGAKKSQDINRPNSFDKIDIPFFVKTWPDICANMTISPQTLPYAVDNIQFLHSCGIKYIISQFSLMSDWKLCSVSDFYHQVMKIVDFYLCNPQLEPWYFFNSNIALTLNSSNACAACISGKTKAYDFITKKYYPCHPFFPSVAGKKTTKELSKIDFANADNLVSSECQDCPFINLCTTCYVDNYISRGAISKRNLSMCKYQKAIFVGQFHFEYARILAKEEPTEEDFLKMKTIQQMANIINDLEEQIIA